MAMKCTNCKKGIMYGHNVSHSKRRTVRTFKPNLHVANLPVNGSTVKLKLCTKCLRTIKKSLKPAPKLDSQIIAPVAV